MSLDIYLTNRGRVAGPEAKPIIVVRDGDGIVEISRAEWDLRHPGQEPMTSVVAAESDQLVFEGNITSNLGPMAREAGLADCIWRPQSIGVERAGDLVVSLRAGLELLRSDRSRFEKHDAPNGWGTYTEFVSFVSGYLAACEKHPYAAIELG